MPKALEQAIEKVRKLPKERVLSDEERRLIREGLEELDRGEMASEAEVRTVFDKYRAPSH